MTEGLDAIIKKAANGDQAAWRLIVDEYGPRVFRLVRSHCRSVELAEEISQSVFCTVAAKLGPVAGGAAGAAPGYQEQGRFEAWLFRIAMNRLRDEMRRRSRQAMTAAPATLAACEPAREDESFAEVEERRRSVSALRSAISRLPDADRQVLELRHFAELSFRQIAELLGEPLGTVLARQHRALKKLKAILSETHIEL